MPNQNRIPDGVKTHRRRFLAFGVACGLVGAAIAGRVGLEWLTHGVSHEVWTLLAATAILFSVQLLGFWVLSELVVASYRDTGV